MRVTMRAARVNADLTQAEFAKKIGVGLKTVQNWEAGSSSPRADMMPAICKALGCQIGDIIFLPKNYG